ncbi:MAG: hypothetical protein ACUVRH_06750 [Candidatus Bipolaricaulia bacterium]
MRRQVWGKTLQVGWFMGLLLLLSMLAGCSLFLPEVLLGQDMNETERHNFIVALNAIGWHDDPMAAAASCYGSATFPAYTKVIDRIIRALQQYLGITSVEQAKAEALRIMGVFVSTMKSSPNPGVVMDLATQGGPAGIIAFVKLMEAQQYADAKYVFPEDIVGFFGKVLQLKGIIPGWSWALFLKHLAAAAVQAVAKVGTSEGEAALEMIARLTLLQDLFSKMHQKGWEELKYGYSGPPGLSPGPFFDFYAKKTFDVSGIGDYPWHIGGWVEPYLSQGDVDRILQQIEDAQAIVQVIANYDPSALANLRSYGESRWYGVRVIIIVKDPDGYYVVYHSRDISDEGAQDICEQITGQQCIVSSSSGSSGGSGSSGSGGQNGSPPDGTYSVPMGDPYTGQCPPGYSFCMI